jgi:hypothetical protein
MTFNKNWTGPFVLSLILSLVFSVSSPVQGVTQWGTAARGMGEAYVASASGLSGISYNPANAAYLDGGEFVSSLSRSNQRSVSINYGTIGTGIKTDGFTHGFALNHTSLNHNFSNFDITSEGLSLDYTQNILYYNVATGLQMPGTLGINLKYFSTNSNLNNFSATGFGFDLGYLYEFSDQLRFGLSGLNLAATRQWETGATDDLAREIRSGLTYETQEGWIVAGDLVHHESYGLQSLHLGIERWWLFERGPMQEQYPIAFRSGLEKRLEGNTGTNLSVGFSYQQNNGAFTYAYQQRSNFDNKHVFGYIMKFTGTETIF